MIDIATLTAVLSNRGATEALRAMLTKERDTMASLVADWTHRHDVEAPDDAHRALADAMLQHVIDLRDAVQRQLDALP